MSLRTFCIHPNRVQAFATFAKSTSLDGIRPFQEVPGPIRLPILGSLHIYKLPGILGGYDISNYHNVLQDLYQKYGPVVREDRGNHTIVHVFEPEDVTSVFSVEGKTPVIPPLQEVTQLYRTERELSLGLGNTNGEEWYRLRSAVQKMMLRPKEVYYYLPFVDSVAKSFVSKIETTLDTNRVSEDLRNLIAKWTLESAGIVCFERRLGAFDKNENQIQKMIQANKEIFRISGILKLSLPIYKYILTPLWSRFLQAEDYFYSQANGFIQEAISTIDNLSQKNELKENQYNFLSYLLSRKELTRKDVFIITLSLFGDGLSTTTPTFLFNLYLLAKHSDVQERVFHEICQHVSNKSDITVDKLNNLQLLKAVVKETFRMYPNGTEVSRIIQSDLVLSNYHIPPGTHVDLNQFVNFRSPKYFHDPEKFIPERWLREEVENKLSHPYLFIPFGHGTRMCAGRRFAEQDIYVGLTRILQNYKLELIEPKGNLEQVYETLLFPKTPLKIRFVKR